MLKCDARGINSVGWPFQILPAGELMESHWSLPMCEAHCGRWTGRKQNNWRTLMKGRVLAYDWLRKSAPSTLYVMSKFLTFIGTAHRKSCNEMEMEWKLGNMK